MDLKHSAVANLGDVVAGRQEALAQDPAVRRPLDRCEEIGGLQKPGGAVGRGLRRRRGLAAEPRHVSTSPRRRLARRAYLPPSCRGWGCRAAGGASIRVTTY